MYKVLKPPLFKTYGKGFKNLPIPCYMNIKINVKTKVAGSNPNIDGPKKLVVKVFVSFA